MKEINNKLSAEQEASLILDALMNDSLSDSLKEEIRFWLSLPAHWQEKERALEESFHKYIQPDTNQKQAVSQSFRDVCLRAGLDYPVAPIVPIRKLKKPHSRTRLAYFFSAAAVLLATASVWLFAGNNVTDKVEQLTIAAAPTVYTSADRVEHIVLPDSTLVVLNANSSITYESRGKVTLTGEAYFEVSKNEAVPFVVSSPTLTVTVLGTRFLMDDRTDTEEAHVKLYSGKIELAAGDAQYDVVPGEWLHLDRQSNTMDRDVIEAETKPYWVYMKMLSLDFASFEDVLNVLSAHFKVSLRNERPELNSELYSVSFNGNESLEEAVSMLQLASNKFNYRIVDNTLIIE